MLDLAGIFHSGFFVHAQVDQPVRQHNMTLIHLISNILTSLGQSDVALVIHVDIAIFTQVLHGNADTRFGKA